jgi:phage gpG-like protein
MNCTSKMSGSFAALVASLDAAQKGEFLEDFATQAADKTVELITQEFVDESDPYGDGWDQLSPRTINAKTHSGILVETSALMGSWMSVSSSSEFGAVTGIEYAFYHQQGTSRIPARPMVPSAGLPPEWEAAYTQIAQDLFARLFATAQAA